MQKIIGTMLMIAIGLSFNNAAEKSGTKQFGGRKTVEQINNAGGEIRKIGETGIYVIWCRDKYLRLNAYNLPEAFRKPGLHVTFSGNIKLTNTLEDEWGELFEVTSISK